MSLDFTDTTVFSSRISCMFSVLRCAANNIPQTQINVFLRLPKLKLLNMSNIFAISIRPAYFPLFQAFLGLCPHLEVAFETARLAGDGRAASSTVSLRRLMLSAPSSSSSSGAKLTIFVFRVGFINNFVRTSSP
ncbi:predicted protein [Arabidopsis lyrata subsp. lyrata]|uniref:Predicted protein n=1 Tax=Arabidopsis lyrata subsp. lyrata TaxID=81972 RepID=D7KE76_ARALL|nr:predicted protein [Arabidopsis lyrata subsp. lyrata]